MREPGIDKRRRDDGQRAAFFDVAGRAEEALRSLQGVRINTTGQNLAGGRHDSVVGPAEARNRVEQDNHVALVLDQALGLFDDHFRDLNVARRRFIERRGDNLAVDRALHVGDFFRAFVDQQHDQVALRDDWP